MPRTLCATPMSGWFVEKKEIVCNSRMGVENMMSSLRKKFCCFFLLLLLAIGGCANNTNEKGPESNAKNTQVSVRFAIVLVKGVKTGDAIKSKIEDLQLETQPVLTDNDLISYKWKEHELELRQDFDFNGSLGTVPLDGLPFIVIANDKRVYLGAFWTPISSISSSIPTVMVMPPQYTIGSRIRIQDGYPGEINSKSDPRSNQIIYNALRSVEKISE
jgi:hypothetical protein